MVATQDNAETGIAWAVAAVPRHYASSERLAVILKDLGKPAAATYLKNKLPTRKSTRSGDLGEIIGAQYAASELGYRMIPRLRWKDHREMSMRGDDILGVRTPRTGSIEFLKGEAKSRARLTADTVAEADAGLQRDNGRPSPHALEFIADRFYGQGETVIARRILEAQLLKGITQSQVTHFLFTFTGNDPCSLLRANTVSYSGPIRRLAVGLEVPKHQAFIAAVYTSRAITGG